MVYGCRNLITVGECFDFASILIQSSTDRDLITGYLDMLKRVPLAHFIMIRSHVIILDGRAIKNLLIRSSVRISRTAHFDFGSFARVEVQYLSIET